MPPKRAASAAAAAAVAAAGGGGGGAAAAAGRGGTRTTKAPPPTKRARRPSPSPSPSPPLPFPSPPPPPPLCPRTIPIALAHLKAADPRLAPLCDAHGRRCAERLGASVAGAPPGSHAAAPREPLPPTFPRLVQTVLAQQLSWKAASTIHRRLLVEAGVLLEAPADGGAGGGTRENNNSAAAFSSSSSYEEAVLRLTPGHVLALPEPRLRKSGVSGAKAAALRDLAQRFSDGRLSDALLRGAATAAPEGLNAALLREQERQRQWQRQRQRRESDKEDDDDDGDDDQGDSARGGPPPPCPGASAAAALLAVRGVGPWTLDMVSMFVLGAPDVLPAGDLGVRKGLERLRAQEGGGGGGNRGGSNKCKGKGAATAAARALPDAAAAERIAASWRPYRTVGSWLMWRLAEE